MRVDLQPETMTTNLEHFQEVVRERDELKRENERLKADLDEASGEIERLRKMADYAIRVFAYYSEEEDYKRMGDVLDALRGEVKNNVS